MLGGATLGVEKGNVGCWEGQRWVLGGVRLGVGRCRVVCWEG